MKQSDLSVVQREFEVRNSELEVMFFLTKQSGL